MHLISRPKLQLLEEVHTLQKPLEALGQLHVVHLLEEHVEICHF